MLVGFGRATDLRQEIQRGGSEENDREGGGRKAGVLCGLLLGGLRGW